MQFEILKDTSIQKRLAFVRRFFMPFFMAAAGRFGIQVELRHRSARNATRTHINPKEEWTIRKGQGSKRKEKTPMMTK